MDSAELILRADDSLADSQKADLWDAHTSSRTVSILSRRIAGLDE
jgi:hypothetical protein